MLPEDQRRAAWAKSGRQLAKPGKRVEPLNRAAQREPTADTIPGADVVLRKFLDQDQAREAVLRVLRRFTITQLEVFDGQLQPRLTDALFDSTELPMKAIQDMAREIHHALVPKSLLARLDVLEKAAKKQNWKNSAEAEGYLAALYLMQSNVRAGKSPGDAVERLRQGKAAKPGTADFMEGARRAADDLEKTYWGEP